MGTKLKGDMEKNCQIYHQFCFCVTFILTVTFLSHLHLQKFGAGLTSPGNLLLENNQQAAAELGQAQQNFN